MIFAPVYCSSEPPPASGPVRSKITQILIFFSWALAETAIPSIAVAAISPPSTRAALTTSIGSLPARWCFLLFIVGAHHRGRGDGCQAARDRHFCRPFIFTPANFRTRLIEHTDSLHGQAAHDRQDHHHGLC